MGSALRERLASTGAAVLGNISDEATAPTYGTIFECGNTYTHDATLVSDNGMLMFEAPAWFQQVSHLDQLLATWEWRASPTPWLVLKPKG